MHQCTVFLATVLLNSKCPNKRSWITLAVAYLALISFCLAYWALLHFVRPVTTRAISIYPGINYSREMIEQPKLMIHRIDIDLTIPNITPLVTTPHQNANGNYHFVAQSTTDFLTTSKSLVAINGGFYNHTKLIDPWRYYPHRGDIVTPHGLIVHNGVRIELYKPGLPALCFTKQKTASIERHGCPASTWQGIAGAALLVKDGIIQIRPRADDPKTPQTAAALDSNGTQLSLYVVDGRQPGYSEGLAQYALAELMVQHKHTMAMSFDGGGSSAMAMKDKFGSRLLNVPTNAGIPYRQRFVATHLGVAVMQKQ
jgi:hypothetical protein